VHHITVKYLCAADHSNGRRIMAQVYLGDRIRCQSIFPDGTEGMIWVNHREAPSRARGRRPDPVLALRQNRFRPHGLTGGDAVGLARTAPQRLG
jgi:hypothetical protein